MAITLSATCASDVVPNGTVAKQGLRALEPPVVRQENRLKVLFQEKNQGKGAALRRGFSEATGDIVIVQDADLEYDPADWPELLEPIVDGRADACFGSRFLGGPHRVLYFWHSVANRAITLFSNMMTNLNLTDMEVGFKVFRRSVLQRRSERHR